MTCGIGRCCSSSGEPCREGESGVGEQNAVKSCEETRKVFPYTSNIGKNLTGLLTTLDSVLLTNPAFSLSTWLSAARAATSNATGPKFYEYDARNQITLWGPDGEISDYASKSWGGLLSGYYVPRWQIFVNYLLEVPIKSFNYTELSGRLLRFELGWQTQGLNGTVHQPLQGQAENLQNILEGLV